jgi:hypothetical protein
MTPIRLFQFSLRARFGVLALAVSLVSCATGGEPNVPSYRGVRVLSYETTGDLLSRVKFAVVNSQDRPICLRRALFERDWTGSLGLAMRDARGHLLEARGDIGMGEPWIGPVLLSPQETRTASLNVEGWFFSSHRPRPFSANIKVYGIYCEHEEDFGDPEFALESGWFEVARH